VLPKVFKTLYQGEPAILEFSFSSDPLTQYGHALSDVTNNSLCFKTQSVDADNAVMQRTDGVVDTVNHKITYQLAPSDTSGLASGMYHVVCALKVPAFSDYIEVVTPAKYDFRVNLLSDWHAS